MRKLLVGFSALGVLVCAAPAFAGFAISATGNVPNTATGLVTPPSNVFADTASTYQIFNEQLSTLTSPVAVDNTGANGSYSGVSPGTSGTISAGTPFGTTYIQLSPGVDGVVNNSGEATILFSSKIIGLALSSANLQSTNIYGAPGTTYPSANAGGQNNNGGSIIGKNNQFFTITDGGRELEIQLTGNYNGFKDIRVFTAGNSSFVPEPASLIVWSVLGTVITGGAWWRRQQRLAV
jgi:hypothetical protein